MAISPNLLSTDTPLTVIESFTLASTLRVDKVRFYVATPTPGALPSFSGAFSWSLYTGADGALIAQGVSAAPGITPTCDPKLLRVELALSGLDLAAGVYWLHIQESERGDEGLEEALDTEAEPCVLTLLNLVQAA